MKHHSLVASVLWMLILLVGCASPVTPTSTSTSVPPTNAPSATPAPPTTATLVTPAPTITLRPTLTATPVGPAVQAGQNVYSATLSITHANGVTRMVKVNYLLYVPHDYGQTPTVKWPLILFLHGSGERGYNAELVASTGLPALLTTRPDFPFMVLSPQSPPGQWWDSQLDVIDALLNRIQSNYAIDPQRLYLTGLSMGGFGVWSLALKYPQRFAALAPIAGGWALGSGALPKNICDLKDVPTWVFHGALDSLVSPQQSKSMVAALQKCGGNVQFTLYPDAGHPESWTKAYADPKLYEWLLQQHRP